MPEKRNYEKCEWTKREFVVEMGKCACIVLVLSLYFYRSLWAALPLSAVGVLCFRTDGKKKIRRDRRRLLLQFRDMIRSVASAMRAGYGVENAFLESLGDMRMMHGADAVICRELGQIRRGLVMNLTLEEMLFDLGERSGAEQIREFAAVFSIAKKSGGSMTEVIQAFSDTIHRQTDTEEEILTQLAGRRMEQNIMSVMPFAILTYIGISSRGYFDALYQGLSGTAIMSACLGVYLAAWHLADRILSNTANVWE